MKLAERFSHARILSGTCSHGFVPSTDRDLLMKRISADQEHSIIHNDKPNLMIAEDEMQPGKFVACLYDQEWHIRCIMVYSEENHSN